MRRIAVVVLLLSLIFSSFSLPVLAGPEVKVIVDGHRVSFDVPPEVVQGRTMVPLRFVAEELGGQVEWDKATQTVTVYKGLQEITLTVGAKEARVNGVVYSLDAPARLTRGRTLVPVRFFAETLRARVDWDGATATVTLTTGAGPDYRGWVTGYYYGANSLRSLQENLDRLTGVFPFAYNLQPDGSLAVDPVMQNPVVAWPEGEALARQNGIPLYVAVAQHDRQVLQEILLNPARRTQVIENLYRLIVDNNYQGLNLDLEQVPATQEAREGYVDLVTRLADRLHAAGLTLSLAVPAKTEDGVSWQLGYDYAGLGQAADYLVIMAYDEHHAAGDPGPVASLPWVEQVVQYAVSQVPRAKILLGIGVYGYDWPAGGAARAVDLVTARDLAARAGVNPAWDAKGYVPYFTYSDAAGSRHQVWYEDARSLSGKLEVVRKYQLGGTAIWRLGMVAPEVWQLIDQSIAR